MSSGEASGLASSRVTYSRISSARQYESRARPVSGHTLSDGVPTGALHPVRNSGPRVRPAMSRGSSGRYHGAPFVETEHQFPGLDACRGRLLRSREVCQSGITHDAVDCLGQSAVGTNDRLHSAGQQVMFPVPGT